MVKEKHLPISEAERLSKVIHDSPKRYKTASEHPNVKAALADKEVFFLDMVTLRAHFTRNELEDIGYVQIWQRTFKTHDWFAPKPLAAPPDHHAPAPRAPSSPAREEVDREQSTTFPEATISSREILTADPMAHSSISNTHSTRCGASGDNSAPAAANKSPLVSSFQACTPASPHAEMPRTQANCPSAEQCRVFTREEMEAKLAALEHKMFIRYHKELAKKGSKLAEKELELANKDSELANRNSELANKDLELVEKESKLAEKELELAKLRQENRDLKVKSEEALMSVRHLLVLCNAPPIPLELKDTKPRSNGSGEPDPRNDTGPSGAGDPLLNEFNTIVTHCRVMQKYVSWIVQGLEDRQSSSS